MNDFSHNRMNFKKIKYKFKHPKIVWKRIFSTSCSELPAKSNASPELSLTELRPFPYRICVFMMSFSATINQMTQKSSAKFGVQKILAIQKKNKSKEKTIESMLSVHWSCSCISYWDFVCVIHLHFKCCLYYYAHTYFAARVLANS